MKTQLPRRLVIPRPRKLPPVGPDAYAAAAAQLTANQETRPRRSLVSVRVAVAAVLTVVGVICASLGAFLAFGAGGGLLITGGSIFFLGVLFGVGQ